MKVAVFTLGLSPPIVTEFLFKLRERNVGVKRAIAVTTEESLPSFHALKLAFWWSREPNPDLREKLWIEDLKNVDLIQKTLTVMDIQNEGDCRSFRTQFSGSLRDALKWAENNPSNIHVCIAGGRKTMPVDAALVCLANGITNVYHVIAPEIRGVAPFTERVRDKKLRMELEEFADKPQEAPKELVNFALEACFPPKELDIHLISFPLPELREEERKKFREKLF
ncbi:MAG: CRISPR-associated ring nuclease [Candidatus Bathyarchaeia archaeon]